MGNAGARKITKNAVRCKRCGDVIESRTVHEFVMCSCGACGVDGALNFCGGSTRRMPARS
jgi:hypothetical protein